MAKIKSTIAIGASKVATWGLRKMGRGGTNLPGRIAKRIDPQVLTSFAKSLTVIIVTGTNGKTTTTRMIEQILKDQGIKYFTNKSGANLQTGIIATFAEYCSVSGASEYTHALLECDEAAFRQVSEYLEVDYLVVNNIFRDQLDRYGEITHTLNAIRSGVKKQANTTLILNADCSLTSSLADDAPAKVIYFGIDKRIYKKSVKEISDAEYCIKCRTKYEYDYKTFAHLGAFSCPNCGYKKHDTDWTVTKIIKSDLDCSEIEVKSDKKKWKVKLNLPGAYNIYNAVASLALADVIDLNTEKAIRSLDNFEVGFGRTEKLKLKKTEARMMLVKNPTGFNQVINYLINTKSKCNLMFVLNDRIADGTDISWIWDVDFETLAKDMKRFNKIYVSGIRKYDMALRLKAAGFDTKKIIVEEDNTKLIDGLLEAKDPVFIMPTYTAMFEIRKALQDKLNLKEFYE